MVGALSCHALTRLCSVTLECLWQKPNESSCFALVFFLSQVTVCFAMYIVAMLGIIISFALRLSLLSRLRYYGFFYYEDAQQRGVSFRQIGSTSPFHLLIWNELNLLSLSSGFAYCIWVSHDHLGSVRVWNPCLLKYCGPFGSEVHQNSGKSRFSSLNMFPVNPSKITVTSWWPLSNFSVESGVLIQIGNPKLSQDQNVSVPLFLPCPLFFFFNLCPCLLQFIVQHVQSVIPPNWGLRNHHLKTNVSLHLQRDKTRVILSQYMCCVHPATSWGQWSNKRGM